jgi:hypothetical protein
MERARTHYQHFPIPFDGPKVVRSTKSRNREKRCRSKSDFNKITAAVAAAATKSATSPNEVYFLPASGIFISALQYYL